MHGEKRDKAKLWKDKNAFNYTCCTFVHIKKHPLFSEKFWFVFLAGNTYWYTKDQPTVISWEKRFTFNYSCSKGWTMPSLCSRKDLNDFLSITYTGTYWIVLFKKKVPSTSTFLKCMQSIATFLYSMNETREIY